MRNLNHLTAVIVCISLALCIAISGCISTDSQNSGTKEVNPDIPPSEIYMFDITNNNETYTVKQDSLIILHLAENPTTGYSWAMNISPGLVVMSDTYEPEDTSGKVVGSGGTRTWELHASKPGTYSVEAIYKRPWEEIAGDEDTFSLRLIVEE